MYKPHFFYSTGASPRFTPELVAVWEVTCGDGHSYTRTAFDKLFYPPEMVSLVRCAQGGGTMETVRGTLALPEGTLIWLPAREIVSYTAVSPVWVYHWYNFTAPQPPPLFEPGRPYQLPVDEEERQRLEQMFLYHNDADGAELVTSLFTLQYNLLAHRESHREREESPYQEQMRAALQRIHAHPEQSICMEALARSLGMSPRSFRAQFAKTYGSPPKAYQQALRLKSAADRLRASLDPIHAVAAELGYSSPFHFSRDFKKAYGMPPTAYRAQHNPAARAAASAQKSPGTR